MDAQVNMPSTDDNEGLLNGKQQLQKRRAVFDDITNVSSAIY